MNASIMALAFAVGTTASSAFAHDDVSHEQEESVATNVEQKAFGHAGNPKVATRTVTISMSDSMQFSPAVLTIKKGETVQFVVKNDGKALHELVLGTEQELAQHAELMRRFPNMQHDEPHMVHVRPGRSEGLVWTFNRPGEFQFACLLPGHFEAGMLGRVVVR